MLSTTVHKHPSTRNLETVTIKETVDFGLLNERDLS